MEHLIVVYERVSTDQQDISRQAVQRERASADHPEAEVRVIQDDGVSAYKVPIFDRPGGRQLCGLIETRASGGTSPICSSRLARA
jgi:DNA invertase Pin-like site-specific DNA recombinase